MPMIQKCRLVANSNILHYAAIHWECKQNVWYATRLVLHGATVECAGPLAIENKAIELFQEIPSPLLAKFQLLTVALSIPGERYIAENYCHQWASSFSSID